MKPGDEIVGLLVLDDDIAGDYQCFQCLITLQSNSRTAAIGSEQDSTSVSKNKACFSYSIVIPKKTIMSFDIS